MASGIMLWRRKSARSVFRSPTAGVERSVHMLRNACVGVCRVHGLKRFWKLKRFRRERLQFMEWSFRDQS
jgi:hypothetical protein